MFVKLKRFRKISPPIKSIVRLNRAEFGTSYSNSRNLEISTNYYPDVNPLLNVLARQHRINEKNLILGMGAESIIKDIFIWHSKKFKNFRKIGINYPNYMMYFVYSRMFSYKIKKYYIFPEKTHNLNFDFIKKFVNKNKIKLLVLVNPAHPFEKNWKIEELSKIVGYCKKKNIIVLLDEVYQDLGSKTAIGLVQKYNNLIIIRSLSKSPGLPGIRVGYLITNTKLREEIETFRLAIELPQDSINIAIKYLGQNNKLKTQRNKQIINARKFAQKQFKIRKINCYGNYHNTLTIKFGNSKIVKKIGNFLQKNRIYTSFNYPKPFNRYINIATTNIENLKIFFKFFDKALKNEEKK